VVAEKENLEVQHFFSRRCLYKRPDPAWFGRTNLNTSPALLPGGATRAKPQPSYLPFPPPRSPAIAEGCRSSKVAGRTSVACSHPRARMATSRTSSSSLVGSPTRVSRRPWTALLAWRRWTMGTAAPDFYGDHGDRCGHKSDTTPGLGNSTRLTSPRGAGGGDGAR
jgi:hypothetical protein